MGLLKFALCSSLLTACYAPDLADCVVSCTSDSDCGGGQTCTDRVCARDGVSCTAEPGTDAAALEPDAMPDTSTDQTSLRVKIHELGSVTVPGREACTATACTYDVDVGTPITLEAIPAGNRIFEKWEEACTGQLTTTCSITPATAVESRVTAKFVKDRDD